MPCHSRQKVHAPVLQHPFALLLAGASHEHLEAGVGHASGARRTGLRALAQPPSQTTATAWR